MKSRIPNPKKPISPIENLTEGKSLESLNTARLFANLSKAEVGSLLGASQMRSFKKGRILFMQEDPAKLFYVINQGWIKLFQTVLNGREVVVEMASRGDTVGIDALFENFLYTSSAQAMEDLQVLCIPLSLLKAQMTVSTTLSLNLLSSLSQKHTRYCRNIAASSALRAPERLAHFLLNQCSNDDMGRADFYLPYDKTSIAYSLRMTRGSFSRALNDLRQQVSIRITRTHVQIDSLQQLREFTSDPKVAKPNLRKMTKK
jgi:CRP-like cAMP-binding protein